jgi:PAS domain-containing protein
VFSSSFHRGRDPRGLRPPVSFEQPDTIAPVKLDVLAVSVTAALELATGAAALWSGDRSSCIVNAAATEMLGFRGADLSADKDLWISRIEPRDRDAFLAFCQVLQDARQPVTCRYRFLPRGTTQAIELQETGLRFLSAQGAPIIFSRYAGAPFREARKLVHKIGNHLQAIRGEVDLLRLSGSLSQENADKVAQSVDAIRGLAEELEKV